MERLAKVKRKKSKKSSQQSSFLGEPSFPPDTLPPLNETIEYATFPKIVRGSFYCPDCKSKVRLRPDGSAVCPKCTTQVPVK